jgi:hypothetical protein
MAQDLSPEELEKKQKHDEAIAEKGRSTID